MSYLCVNMAAGAIRCKHADVRVAGGFASLEPENDNVLVLPHNEPSAIYRFRESEVLTLLRNITPTVDPYAYADIGHRGVCAVLTACFHLLPHSRLSAAETAMALTACEEDMPPRKRAKYIAPTMVLDSVACAALYNKITDITAAQSKRCGELAPERISELYALTGCVPEVEAPPAPQCRQQREAQPTQQQEKKQRTPRASASGGSDVTREPDPGTTRGRIWAIADALHKQTRAIPERAEVVARSVKQGIKETTATASYRKWRKFRGI